MDRKQYKDIVLSEKDKLRIAKILQDHYDLELIELDAYPHNTVYRPKCRQANGQIQTDVWFKLTKHMGKIRMAVASHGSDIDDKDHHDLGEPMTKEEAKVAKKQFREQAKMAEQMAIENLSKIKLFDNLDKLERIDTCNLIEQKKLTMPKNGQAFIAKEITLNTRYGERTHKDCVVVPFYHARDSKRPCGIQIRLPGIQRPELGSLFGDGAYSVVQEGIEHYDLGITDLIIVESWSTACALANALGESYRVICGAGINTVRAIHDRIINSEDAEKYNIIHALDKTEGDKPRDKNVEKLKAHLNETGYSYIQLPKAKNDGFYDFTDFGDVLEKRGLPALQKWLKGEMRLMRPERPEVVDHDDRDFFYKVSWNNKIMKESKKSVLDSSYVAPIFCTAYANSESFMSYEKRNEDKILLQKQERKIKALQEQLDADEINQATYNDGVKKATVSKELLKKVRQEIQDKKKAFITKQFESWAQLNKEKGLKGIGTYIENETVVLNTRQGRFLYNGDNLEYTDRRIPVAYDKYADMYTADGLLDVTKAKFTRGVADSIKAKWMRIFEKQDNRNLYELAFGYNLIACYSAIVDRRANLWSHGDSGSGKSTSFRSIMKPLFKPYLYSTTDVTKAGLVDALTEDGSVDACDSVRLEESNSKYDAARRLKEEEIREFVKNHTDSSDTEQTSLTSNPSRTHVARKVRSSFQFSSVNIPGKLGKEFISRVCFLPFLPDTLVNRVPAIKETEVECEKLRPHILDLIAKGAKLIAPTIEATLVEVTKVVPNTNGELSHKPVTLACILAGYIVSELVADGSEDIEGYAKRIVASQKQQLLDQVTYQRSQITDTSTLVSGLKELKFKPNIYQNYGVGLGSEGTLVVAMLRASCYNDQTQYNRLCRESGCWITEFRGEYGFRFETKDLAKVSRFLKSNSFVDPVYMTERDIGDLAGNRGSGVSKERGRKNKAGKSGCTVYTIDITDVYEGIKSEIEDLKTEQKELVKKKKEEEANARANKIEY